MEISVEELNELLQKEYERGRNSSIIRNGYSQIYEVNNKNKWKDFIPESCKNCPQHPSNGGSGICHCILGTQPIMYTTTTSNEVK